MTLFEYLVVLLSIVLSLGLVRLLDGLPPALKPGRRHPLHITWLVNVFFLHVQYWWVFWSYNRDVSWTYPRFILALASPVLLYSLAITVVPREPTKVESWLEYFWEIRTRFFYLLATWMATVALANWLTLGQPFLNPLRLGQFTAFLLYLTAANTDRRWFHKLLAIATVVGALLFVTVTFFQPAPLAP